MPASWHPTPPGSRERTRKVTEYCVLSRSRQVLAKPRERFLPRVLCRRAIVDVRARGTPAVDLLEHLQTPRPRMPHAGLTSAMCCALWSDSKKRAKNTCERTRSRRTTSKPSTTWRRLRSDGGIRQRATPVRAGARACRTRTRFRQDARRIRAERARGISR